MYYYYFTLISILLGLLKIYWFDGIVGIGISAWICITGVKIFIESYNILIDTSIDSTTQDIISNLAQKYTNIKKIDNISSSPVGYKYVVFITIALMEICLHLTAINWPIISKKIFVDLIKFIKQLYMLILSNL